MLLAAVRVSLPFRVDRTDPDLHRGLEVRQFRPAGTWMRFGGEWALVAGLLDSATGGRASRMHPDRPWRKRRPREAWRPGFTLLPAPAPPKVRRRSRSDVLGKPLTARRLGFRRTSTISRPESVHADHGVGARSPSTAADARRHRNGPSFGRQVGDGGFHGRPQSSHPVYLGMGNDAVDAAYTTYLDIVGTSARNQRKAVVNPVNFVGRR